QTNLYKCFLPLGWRLAGSQGVTAYLHQEGPYDDPKGGGLREALYPRLRAHFQFQNELALFPIGDRRKYSINLYGPPQKQPDFDHKANLFTPALSMPVMRMTVPVRLVVIKLTTANGIS